MLVFKNNFRVLGSSMATEERTPASVRSSLLRGHHRHGRRAGASGGIHRRLPYRKHGKRLGQAWQLVGRPPPPPVILLDPRAAVFFHATLVHGTRLAGSQAHDRSQAHTGWSHVHK